MFAAVQLSREFMPLLLIIAGAAASAISVTRGHQPDVNRRALTSTLPTLSNNEASFVERHRSPSGSSTDSDSPMSGDFLSSSATGVHSFPDDRYGAAVTSPNNEIEHSPRSGVAGRGARDVAESACESFTIGNDAKREFYSPNYPDNYPNQTDCIKVLRADKGMLLKVDFRERFDLEPSEACRFDYLEIRDGEHGYADIIGSYCGRSYPPEIVSGGRYLWLKFHSDESIEYSGFKIIWSMIPRPTDKGVPPESEPCVKEVTGPQAIINSTDFLARKEEAVRNGVALDCMWAIRVGSNQKVQLQFTEFKLQKPNECDANFVDVFNGRTQMPDRLRNFCGSIADLVSSTNNTVFIRYYAKPRAINSSFVCLVTAYREKKGDEKICADDEFDCEDARCIADSLKCNNHVNCRFKWDEEAAICGTAEGSFLMDKEHIVIILVVFSLIVFGMSFTFVFNCVRKLIRDHRIIQEHIRQSREDRLDEIGRKTTPCPLSTTTTTTTRADSRDRRKSSESPSLEVVLSKELLPAPAPGSVSGPGSSSALFQAQEYARELLAREALEINDIHRSNNASNATQERLQESSEEPETRDNACQTRESLFDGALPPRRPPSSSQCSACGCGPAAACPRHVCIPPPPHGWSLHDSRAPVEPSDYLCSYQRFQSPKPPTPVISRDHYRSPGKYSRQSTRDSSGRTTLGSSHHYSGSPPSTQPTSGTHGSHFSHGSSRCSQGTKLSGHGTDPRYRAEAVIELPEQDRRPFSIDSTKSAPDVIVTH